ncbi:putative shionone synthase [Helianthus anomalus]
MMWISKIADWGIINPHLCSTKNFVGRQIWEFDPNYVSLEERADVEQALAYFWKHKHVVKTSRQ